MNKTIIIVVAIVAACVLAGFIVYTMTPSKTGLDRFQFVSYDKDSSNSLIGGLKLKND